MRQLFAHRGWVGNTALAVMLFLIMSLSVGGLASAGVPPAPTPTNGIVQTLQQANGQTAATVSFDVSPTTPPFTGVWLNIFGPSGQSLTNGPTQVTLPTIANNVYSIVYQVYLNVTSLLASIPSIVGQVYGTAGGILYNVYLQLATPVPVSTTTTTTTTTTTGTQPVTSQGTVVGTLQTTTQTINGVATQLTQVQVDATSVQQALSALPATSQSLTISVPASAVPAGGVVQVNLPPAALQAVASGAKSLSVATPSGTVTLPPAVLSQIAAQVGSGQQVTLQVNAAPASQLTEIQSSLPPSQTSTLQTAGTPVDISVEITTAGTQGGTVFEPSNGQRVDLSLPYNSAQVTGLEALKLGVYRYDVTTKAWEYVGGSTDLATGTVLAPVGHLSTYAVLADNQTFPDIQGYWAQTDIELMVAHHVVDGMSATSFDPTGSVTRAQFAAMIARALNLPTTSTASSFSDVSPSAWYAGVVAAAAKAGIVRGYPNGTFGPDQQISRQEMAVMIVRAMRAAGQPATVLAQQVPAVLSPYGDAASAAPWARQDLAIAIEQSIVKGVTATSLAPQTFTTRAQAAVMVKRLLGYLKAL